MTTPSTSDLSALREVAVKATPGPWDVWREPCADKYEAANELSEQAHLTDGFAGAVFLLNANGKCPASTGCGPTSEANAAFIAAANPQTVLALLDELERLTCDLAAVEQSRDTWKASSQNWWARKDQEADRAETAEARSTALLDHLAAEKARADAAEAERDAEWERRKISEAVVDRIWDIFGRPSYEELAGRSIYDLITDQQATISTLTAERDALIRERDEAREARVTLAMIDRLVEAELDSALSCANGGAPSSGRQQEIARELDDARQAVRSALSGAKDEREG